jgi:AAA15 family ATPase/GTPase
MKIDKFQIRKTNFSGWNSNEIEFGNVNLLVGNSGSGKSNLLTSIFSMGTSAVRTKDKIIGSWKVDVRCNDTLFKWDIEYRRKDDKSNEVVKELITVCHGDDCKIIVDRTIDNFLFNGVKLPKISIEDSAIYLLKEEESIKPLFDGMSNIIRRDFASSKMKNSIENHLLDLNEKENIGKNNNLLALVNVDSLNDRLDIINKHMNHVFENICESFKEVFPFIVDMKIVKQKTNIGIFTILNIKEKNCSEWVPLDRLSSGMQKVLYVLTDIYTLPKGAIYLIDEYENSLGINAIDFFPDFLAEHFNDNQFFITSHHPYIINHIPVKNWYICHRSGTEIKVKYGQEIVDRYGPSKQKAFYNLINDPFYTEGIE